MSSTDSERRTQIFQVAMNLVDVMQAQRPSNRIPPHRLVKNPQLPAGTRLQKSPDMLRLTPPVNPDILGSGQIEFWPKLFGGNYLNLHEILGLPVSQILPAYELRLGVHTDRDTMDEAKRTLELDPSLRSRDDFWTNYFLNPRAFGKTVSFPSQDRSRSPIRDVWSEDLDLIEESLDRLTLALSK